MPSTANAAGRRKVRCPKCTALLAEPQTQIYKCPICLTLLLAKGNPSGTLPGNRVVKGSGEADDVQQLLEGGGKPENAILINEYGKEFEGRNKKTQEGFNPLDIDNESLSEISTTRVMTEPVDHMAIKNSALAPDTPPDTPYRRKLPHDAEISPRGGSEHQSSELDSVSHSGSEVDVDSPIWSSENANVNEATEVSSRHGDESSAEHMSPAMPTLSGGAAGNDGERSPQEGTRFDLRKPSEARNFDVQKAKDEDHREVADNKGGDSSSDNVAGSTGSKSPPNNKMDSPKDSKQQTDLEIPKVGKFGLFDLSVFGIYNEDTYSELRRGKAAHYTKLSESGSDGEVPCSRADRDLVSHSLEVTPQTSSQEQDGAGNNLDKSTDEVKESCEVPEVAVGSIHTDMGSHKQVHEDEELDTELVMSCPVGQEVDHGAIAGSVGQLPEDSTVDSDVLANARYGDDMPVRDVSLDGISSVDISFGDWRLQQASSPPQKPLEQTYMDANPLYEQGRLVLAAGEEGSESSWDDDEEDLTFSSTSKEDSNAKGMSLDSNAKAPPSRRRSVGRSQAKALTENLAFPIRTTAMQKFLLQRNETDPQEAIMPELEQSEAPSVKHHTTLLREEVHKSSTSELVSQDTTTIIVEDKRAMIATSVEVEEKDTKITERQSENTYSAHTVVVSTIGNEAVLPAPVVWKEDHTQTTDAGQFRKEPLSSLNEAVPLPPLGWKEKDGLKGSVEDYYAQPREESDAMRSPRKAEAGMEMRADLNSQNMDGFKHHSATRTGAAPGKPVSLRWKGRSSNQSLSSTDDDGAYGMESEAGSGPDKDSFKEQGVGLTHGTTFPDREAQQGTRAHAQRTWLNNIDMDRQKHGSGELITSRRSARSRAANARMTSQETFEQVEAVHFREAVPSEGRIPIKEFLGRPRSEHVSPTPQGQGLNINMSRADQETSYLYNGLAGYSSDRSQDVPSHSSQYNEAFVSNPYGLAAGGSTQAYPYQVPASARASSQESGLTGATHHCLSPNCSLCMQQQYYMQPAQMLQNVMLPHCAACASQSSAATYHQPVHHGMHHSHHVHGAMHLNPPLRQHDSGALPPQSRRQDTSSIHIHPLPLARRPKLYPPLPGKDAPPYVLCKHCNQLLEAPGYLPPVSRLVQKLQCGSCDKISMFSVPLQAASPSTDRAQWATSGGVAVHASGSSDFLARDKRQQMDTTGIHSSDQAAASGLSASAKNSYGMAARTSGQGSHQKWVDDRVFLRSSGSGAPQAKSAVSRHQARPMAGGVPAQYRHYERNDEGDDRHNSTGLYSEGYISSSPSSPSGSSPGRPPQVRRQYHQQGESVRQRISGYGERKLTPDQDADRLSYEVPRFSDDFYQKGPVESTNKFSSTSLQGSVHGQYSDGPDYDHLDRLQQASKAGSWHDRLADTEYAGRTALRTRMEQVRRMPAAPGSPLMEHFSQDSEDAGLVLQQRHMPQNTGSGVRSTPWSPASDSPHVDSLMQDSLTDFSERSYERERPPLPVQDASKGPKSFAGMLKRSVKDFGRGGQGGNTRRKVVVNGHLIQEVAVRKAEERAGPVHSGSYWYDYQAGFWGVMGGPCSGILMPFIEEFHYPLARDCAGGRTRILVNGRELHERDLEVLAKRGLPTIPGKAYILDISGALFDDATSQPLRGLGKLAPSIEKKGRGFGMSPVTALP